MRLIDADKLIDRFKKLKGSDTLALMLVKDVIKEISKQPTACDVDKVVEQIKELGCKGCEYADDFERCRKDCDCKEISERAIEIVKSGGIERYEKR